MNKYFKRAMNQAIKAIQNPDKTKKTIDKAIKRADNIKNNEGFIALLKDNVQLFFNMIYDFIRGRYRVLPMQSAVKILAGLIYFLFLIDLIPDFIAGVGLVDDAAVLTWVVSSVAADINKYKQWKASQESLPLDETEDVALLIEE